VRGKCRRADWLEASAAVTQTPAARPAEQRALPFGEPTQPLRAFWQARFYDFNVYTEKKKKEKLEYMHGNPVARGLVSHLKDWACSSWLNYAKDGQGLIPVDLL
jgi:hypothetical protein